MSSQNLEGDVEHLASKENELDRLIEQAGLLNIIAVYT